MSAFIIRKAKLLKETENCFRVEHNGKICNWVRYSKSGDVLTKCVNKATGEFHLSGWVAKAVEKSERKQAA